MFNVKRLLNTVKSDEGFRLSPYRDSVGVWTVGYGSTSWAGHPVTGRNRAVTEAEASIQLKADLLDAYADADQLYATLHSYPAQLQEILVMLAYQLGLPRLSKFERMNRAIGRLDLTNWALELEDSLLYRQCTNRIERYLKIIDGTQCF